LETATTKKKEGSKLPATSVWQEFEVEGKDRYRKCQAEITLKVDGRELPNLEVLGRVLEECIERVILRVKESHMEVPPRTDTPIAEPYSSVK
jgi:hypothetical protein